MTREHLPRGKEPRPRGMTELRFRVPRGVYDRMTLLAALTGDRRREWVIRALTRAVEDGLRHFPVHVCWLRPGCTIFSLAGSTYTPIAKAAGGERAWPIEVVEMPSILTPFRQGWRVDVTTDTGGFEGRGVCVAIDSVVGEPIPHRPGG